MIKLNDEQLKKLNDLVDAGVAESAEALLDQLIDRLWQSRIQNELGGLSKEAIARLREMHEEVQAGGGYTFESVGDFRQDYERFMKIRAEARARKAHS
ncbi:MAG: hypothetical protein KDB07_00115 [Planctomycetes bacterium]|nr:hypothetical protein [Planctomycetota bacterium]